MKKTVLFVDPPFHAFFEYDRWWFSLSGAQLAACLKARGMGAYVYDADRYFPKDPKTKLREEMVRRQDWYQRGVEDGNHHIWQHFRKTLSDIKPEIVAVTTWTSKMKSTLMALSIVKEVDPNIVTVVGGYHASTMPQDFAGNGLVDAILLGPAETSLVEWVEAGCKEKYIETSPRDLDLTKVPQMDRGAILFPEHFSISDWGAMQTSRGCPFNCSFCSNKVLNGQKYLTRTPEQVRAEVEEIVTKWGPRQLRLLDPYFVVDIQRTLRIAEIFHSYGLTWGCDARVDCITEELVAELVEHGCTHIAFGIETGTNAGLKRLNKQITLDQVRQTSDIMAKFQDRLVAKYHFVVGFPDDTLEDLEATHRFALSLHGGMVSLNSFVPLPGTDVFNAWKSTFAAIPDIYDYNQLNPKANFIKAIPQERYRTKFMDMLKDFDDYNSSANGVATFHPE